MARLSGPGYAVAMSAARRIVLGAVALILASVVCYLLAWPTVVRPVAWQPPTAPALEGPWASNGALDAPELLGVDVGPGPEHLAFDARGRVAVGYQDGRLVTFDADGKNARELANTHGRPLGLVFRGEELIVCDSLAGLLSVAPDGTITVLATEADGGPFRFADGVDVARDGTLYFTDASSVFSVDEYQRDLIEHGGRGRLLALAPGEARPRVLLSGLQFANGVALAPDDSFVLFVETGSYRVSKLWLTGERTGRVDVIIDNLPGFPDNLSRGQRGAYWIGLTAPRNALIDALGPHPFLRTVIDRLPRLVQPKAQRRAHVVGIDDEGHVLHNLVGTGATHALVAGAVEHEGWLYLASLHDPHFARVRVPAGG